jgi:hypothetical protein
VYGLEKDFKASGGSGNWDGWLQVFANLIRDKVGKGFVGSVTVEPIEYHGKVIAKIIVKKSHRPAFVEKKDATFYIRNQNTSIPINTNSWW